MSNETIRYKTAYEHFSPAFYTVWGDDPEIMARAQAVNDMFNTYLYAFDVAHPWELRPEIQQFLYENSRVIVNLGEGDE